MLKRALILALVSGILINLFSTPIAMLVYEINQQVQVHGSSGYQEFAMTVCETSCAIQKRFVVEQHFPDDPLPPVSINFKPLALYWQHLAVADLSPPFLMLEMKKEPFQLGVTNSVINDFFVPPQSA
jgi:hypothetical protein